LRTTGVLNAYGNTLAVQSGRPIVVNLETVSAPLDGRWWDVAASRLLEFTARCGLPDHDLRALTVLVPRLSDAPWLRAALHRALGGGAGWVAPRIATLERWVGAPGAQTQRLVELYEALRASDWAREAFGERPAALWALAAELAGLADELTLAAVGSDPAFEGRWRDSVARHFQRRAARAASVQSQLVLQLWKAHSSAQFGAGALLRNWARRAPRAHGPLALLAPFGLPPWQQVLLHGLARAQPVCAVLGDLRAALSRHGWLELTWPELAAPDQPPAPMAWRCEAARAQAPPQLRILPARSLEQEASAAAYQVESWLRDGAGRVALIALDRLTARRVRALLERARILVADQAGWKLSTTSAAAAVMRWLELAGGDFRIRDLLDWLRSPFVLGGRPERLAAAWQIDQVARSSALAGGLRAIDRALSRHHGLHEDRPGPVSDARAVLAQLAAQARHLRSADTLDALSVWLDASLDALGMREALARDPVGSDVLRELGHLRDSMAASRVRMSLPAFRELLAQHFESTNASGAGADSAVVMTSLAGACLRGFDCAILIGVGAEHLPSSTEPGVLISAGVRRDLGLATLADAHRAQAVELATLLCSVPAAAATWRMRERDEPRALSPWLDRLRVMAARAGWPDPVAAFEAPIRTVPARPSRRPAPGAAHRLPDRLSVGACQSLVDCPYQFYARYLLGLRRRELASDLPDKRDLGTALHTILYRLHCDFDPDRLERMTDIEVQQALEHIVREVFDAELRERPALIAYRRRLLDLMADYARWLRRRTAAGWRLQSVETAFRLPLRLDLFRSVELSGRIDRIDARGADEIELIDYKTGSREKVRDAADDPGENIQLPLYALACFTAPSALASVAPAEAGAEEAAAAAAATSAKASNPAAEACVKASYLSFERSGEADRRSAGAVRQFAAAEPFDRWVALVRDRLLVDLTRISQGAGLEALGAEPTCSHCEMRGLCRRAEWGPG
jgi:ATP-dependent helicase/nuclease subunit B